MNRGSYSVYRCNGHITGTNMNARCTIASPQKLVFPTIFNDFEKSQSVYNARDPAPVHTASRIADTLFSQGIPRNSYAESMFALMSKIP